jgi:uncharacterized protein (DUF4415 family)
MSKVTKAQLEEIKRLAEKPDSEIDVSDIPEVLDWSNASVGRFYRPLKRIVTLRLDADVLARLKKQGKGYQTRINAVLRESAIGKPFEPEIEGETSTSSSLTEQNLPKDFDPALLFLSQPKISRYDRRIRALREAQLYTQAIEATVEEAIQNISKKQARSFVVYGEPQSGKTEMMIALTARLLDEGHRMIIVLMNDSVQLLNQNLTRFRKSGLDPAPRSFSEVLDSTVDVTQGEFVVFCKKNYADLRKLIAKVDDVSGRVIIDDEADYATPNAKINKGEQTRINELVGDLLGEDGFYIGVTATPARLDLNRTFENENELWVEFKPHPEYRGYEFFFPRNGIQDLGYLLNILPDDHDRPEHLASAVFQFFVNAAYLNLQVNNREENYSLLIHTSGKRVDHSDDYRKVIDIFNALKSPNHPKFGRYARNIWVIAKERFAGFEHQICSYIVQNINRHAVIVMNSDLDKKNVDYGTATDPVTLFTVAIGGNIVSRGVTFNNLLSMFFTRDAKHKIQQDTYIQRARMFGRRDYDLRFFELTIPENLYVDWHRCFVFHRLALESIRAGYGSPVWLQDNRLAVTGSASIYKSRLDMDSGEMSFRLFDYSPAIERIFASAISPYDRLEGLAKEIGEESIPTFLREYVKEFSPAGKGSVAIHASNSIENYGDANKGDISRTKGLIGKSDREEQRFPQAIHHFKIFFNAQGKARLFYRYHGSISFLRMKAAA